MHHWHHLIGQSLSQWTWDLSVPTLFIFPSIFIILHANTSLAALQSLYAYLFSILTWRLIVCTLVPCLHPRPLKSHVDSCTCDPAAPFSISNVLILLYLLSLIIISLIPIVALRISKLLSYSLDKVSDIGTLFNTSIHCSLTDTSIRDYLCPALGLSGRSH